MKYAILGDVHANLEALNAVLDDAEMQGATHYACTGDMVGYNADPKACLKKLRKINASLIQGNHDYYASCNESMERFTPLAKKSIHWTRKQLSFFERKYLRNLPLIRDIENFSIVHSSLKNPHDWTYILKPKAANASFNNQFSTICFYGHTHIPMAFIQTKKTEKVKLKTLKIEKNTHYLINVGSVGQPRDRNPDATYVLYDLEHQTVQLRRVPYDIKTTQLKIRNAGLPFRNALRLSHGR